MYNVPNQHVSLKVVLVCAFM